jgi:hypothetical protein
MFKYVDINNEYFYEENLSVAFNTIPELAEKIMN